MTAPPSPLPLSLPAGIRSKRRAVYAVGVVTLLQHDDGHGPGYLGNWQPVKPSDENMPRKGASWLPVAMIDWSTVG